MKLIKVALVALAITISTINSEESSTISTINNEESLSSVSICAAGDKIFMGEFLISKEESDSAPIYSNANDMSFFRHNGFWYLGDLNSYPPKTHYRCLPSEDLAVASNMMSPPTSTQGSWTATKLHGKEPIPMITSEACSQLNKDISSDKEL
jgi:hypothetical protein|mmetsp:Transcript_31032/g.29636  ORF Transcript_31032/g.29636 Transcript_31032/m.29636 type:complete len:152 (+) Transcript_31032:127-582(+)